mgnify:FL=1
MTTLDAAARPGIDHEPTGREICLSVTQDLVEIGTAHHKMCLSRTHGRPTLAPCPTRFYPAYLPRNRPARFQPTTAVRVDGLWKPVLDEPSPLVSGEQFDFYPDGCVVLEDSPARVAVLVSGVQPFEGYHWEAVIECLRDSPLIHVRATCFLTAPLFVSVPQPSVALRAGAWRPQVALNQGPGNIYTGHAENGWGNAFPAAYAWGDGIEVGFFAQMSPLTWMTGSRFNRAYRVHVDLRPDGTTAIGLIAHDVTRNPIPAGAQVVADFYLYAAARPDQPTKLAALDRLVDVFSDCHPADAELPLNRRGGPTTWRHFSRGLIRNLLVKDEGGNVGACWDHLELQPPWDDGLTEPRRRLRLYSDYALQSGSWPLTNRKRVADLWDFSTCFNVVAPWIGIERLNPDPAWREALGESTRGFPLFYHGDARMVLRWTRRPKFDMPWQFLTFYHEMLKVHDMLAPEHFDPAVGGSVLLGLPGLIELARNEEYVWSQFVRPLEKTGEVNQDVTSIGRVREPWQNGSYAWVMARAYEMTGDRLYLQEAGRSLDALLGGTMRYTVANEHYEIDYADPTDFPITEIFGNGYGIAAGEKLFELTGDARYQRYARDFFNSLARVAFWYESNLDTDPRDRILGNAGLFQAYHSYAGAAPWETIEAYLPMTVMLRADNPLAPVGLMLRMFNTMRINAFWFFPPVFSGEAVTSRELLDSPADYVSIENFYMPERGGDHGGMGRCTYMTQIALWNDLLFESFASCDDPRVMVLNLDVLSAFHEAAMGIERNFFVFNPTESARVVTVRHHHLPRGLYCLSCEVPGDGELRANRSAHELEEGIHVSLPPLGRTRLRLWNAEEATMREALVALRAAQGRLCDAYRRWRQARDAGCRGAVLALGRQRFQSAMDTYRTGAYRRAEAAAAEVWAGLPA